MGSGFCNWRKQTPSGKKSSPDSAKVKATENSNKVETPSGNLVQNHECENTSKKAENSSLVLTECEKTSRKLENFSPVLKEGEKRNQQFAKTPLEPLPEGNLEQDSGCQGTSKEVENSTGLSKKNEDQRAETSSFLDLKEKGKNIQQCDKNQPELSLEKQSVKKTTQKTEEDAPKPGPKNHSNQPTRRETPTSIYHITWDEFEEFREELGQKCCVCEIDLADDPYEEAEVFYDEIDVEYYEEFSSFPEGAVLPCGHAFHANCLTFVVAEEKSRDPPCYICAK